MKKIKKVFAFMLLLVMIFSQLHFTVVRGNYSGQELLIPVTITWDGNDDSNRPASVTLTLYKYLGEFDQTAATLVETKTVTAADEWKYNFDISDQELYYGTEYSTATAYKFKVVQSSITDYGYQTTYVDPIITFNPPEVAGDGWDRITPCSELDIVTTGSYKSIVLMKKGNSCTVWTIDKLSDNEKQLIINSALDGIQGIGNPSFHFCYGLGVFLPCGMTVTETLIHFENHSNWSILATGVYNKSSALSNAAYITNTRNTYGDLRVSKIIAGNAPSAEQKFTFTVTLGDNTINGTYGAMTFNEGVATFELKGGESLVAEDLPNGVSYVVTEADYSLLGYVTTSTGAEGTISETEPRVAAFVNTRNTYGDLKVTKTLEGNDTSIDQEFEFIVTLNNNTIDGIYGGMLFESGEATFTLKGGETILAVGLPNGVTYTVTEEDYSLQGYETAKTGDTGTIEGNQEKTAAFTNTRNTYGRLIVYKSVAGNAADATKKFDFTVTLSDKTITGTYGKMTFNEGVATFSLADGEWLPASGLPNGITYIVTEADYSTDGYVTTKTGDTGTIVGGDFAVAAFFTNTRNAAGTLTIAKNLAGNDVDVAKKFEFTITLSDTSINETYSEVVFTEGVATLKLRGGEIKVIEGLPNGIQYTVEEADYSALGYTTTKEGDTGTILENTPQYATFTNTRNSYGTLTVSKTTAGNAADSNKDFAFKVTLGTTAISGTYGDMTFNEGVATFILKNGESVSAEGLPNGITYTVVEDYYGLEGYITTKVNDIGTIVGNSEVIAAFTNTRNAEGSLTIYKILEGNDVDTTKEFEFTITLSDTNINATFSELDFINGVATFTLKGGTSKVIEELPNGIGYTIIEVDYTGDGYTTIKTGDVGTISETVSGAAVFTNTRNTYGDLRVTKTLAGNAADTTKEFVFTITLSDNTVNGIYGGMTFNSGVSTHILKAGEWVTAVGLPNGITYTVTEDDYSADGYVTTKTGDTGTITGGKLALAEFTNTRNAYSKLSIRKTVTGDKGETDKYFTFTINFDAEGSYEYTGSNSGTISNGGEIQLKDGEEITIHDLPVGTTYSVTESDNDSYKVTATGDSGVIEENVIALAHFTNNREKLPSTGDNTNIYLWIGIMGLSLLGIVVMLFGKKTVFKMLTKDKI
jgi:LPXTG-motif cell wall-anchored protein